MKRNKLRKQLKGTILAVRVVDDLAHRVEQEAQAEGMSRADLLRRMLQERYRLRPKILVHS